MRLNQIFWYLVIVFVLLMGAAELYMGWVWTQPYRNSLVSSDVMIVPLKTRSRSKSSSPAAAGGGTTAATTLSQEQQQQQQQHQQQEKQMDYKRHIVCIQDSFFGRNANRMIQLANALSMKEHTNYNDHGFEKNRTTVVGLGKRWSRWYRELFDTSPRVLLDYYYHDDDGSNDYCDDIISANQLQFLRDHHEWNAGLALLQLKESIRNQARRAVRQYITPNNDNKKSQRGRRQRFLSFVSVHRRELEDSCQNRARAGMTYCLSSSMSSKLQSQICHFVYNEVREEHRNNNNTLVVLFTDGQNKELDDTFPMVVDQQISFGVQMWMMTLSTFHYGNPMSSVDYVIAHWRKGKDTWPMECFQPQQQQPQPQPQQHTSSSNVIDNDNATIVSSASFTDLTPLRAGDSPPTISLQTAPTRRNSTNSITSAAAVASVQQQQIIVKEENQYVVCIQPDSFFGRNANRMIQLANALTVQQPNGEKNQTTVVGLGERWSRWYRGYFDISPQILLNYPVDGDSGSSSSCDANFTANYLQFMRSHHEMNPGLMMLKLKKPIRNQAERAINQYQRNFSKTHINNHHQPSFVSVHRRDLEETCEKRVRKNFCFFDSPEMSSPKLVRQICNFSYSDVTEEHRNNDETMVVLFTDEQNKELDATFPILDHQSFAVQMWMMTLSTFHYGNPMSSVDYVVAHWRQGKDTWPIGCFSDGSSKDQRKKNVSRQTSQVVVAPAMNRQVVSVNSQGNSVVLTQGVAAVSSTQQQQQQQQLQQEQYIVCIRPDKFVSSKLIDRISQLGNALAVEGRGKKDQSTVVALGPSWSEWYLQYFDPSPYILLNYLDDDNTPCDKKFSATMLQYFRFNHEINPGLFLLRLKESIRQEAEQAVNQYYNENNNNDNNNMESIFVSVHGRDSQKACDNRMDKTYCILSETNDKFQETTSTWKNQICNFSYKDILPRHRDNKDTVVVLFTDPDDSQEVNNSTFPIVDNNRELSVQMWMMTLSSFHYGNPMSNVDYIIAHWRHDKDTWPAGCFNISNNINTQIKPINNAN